jgi:hypothetical protein
MKMNKHKFGKVHMLKPVALVIGIVARSRNPERSEGIRE